MHLLTEYNLCSIDFAPLSFIYSSIEERESLALTNEIEERIKDIINIYFTISQYKNIKFIQQFLCI